MARLRLVLVSVVCSLLVSACAHLDVNRLPQPGASYGGGYDIIIEFSNVLNLPSHGKVTMDGTTIGIVESVDVKQTHVDVTARIARGVNVPSNVHAVLQQATLLGDIYVALEPPPEGSAQVPGLSAGDRIPVDNTTSPPQLEDTIANLASFIGSGSIQKVQNAIISFNRVAPSNRDEIRRVTSQMTRDLLDLSENVDQTDVSLMGLANTAQVLADQAPTLHQWFSPHGMTLWNHMTTFAGQQGVLIPSVASVYTGGYWNEPLLQSLGRALGAIQQSKWAVEEEYLPWRELFTDKFLPEDKFPAINITSVVAPDGRDITGKVADILRMVGATR